MGREERDDFAQFGAYLSHSGDHRFLALRRVGSPRARLLTGCLVNSSLVPHRGRLGLLLPVCPFQRLAGTGDGVTLAMHQPLDLESEFNLAAAVQALAGAALVGLQLRELRLPETED